MSPKKLKPIPREAVIRQSWLRGMLDYKFHQGQKDLKQAFLKKSLGQIFVNECARQFGKTYFWAAVALETAFSIPKARIKFGTAFLTDLTEFVLPAFDAVLEDCPEDLLPVYKAAKSKFILPHNGSEIKLVGLDLKPNGMRGNVIDLIIIDESGFTNRLQYLYKSVIIPATTHRPNCRVALSSSTPKEEDHEFFEFVEKAEYEGAYIKKTIHDNPMIDETTKVRLIYELGGEDSEEWQREYLCKRIRNKDLTIVPEWSDNFVQNIPKDEYYPFYHKYVTMDLGVSRHKTAVLFGYYDFLKAKLIIEDEWIINGPELTTDQIDVEIKVKELALYSGIQRPKRPTFKEQMEAVDYLWARENPNVYRRTSDTNNPLLLQDLSHLHKIHFSPAKKGSLEEMTNALRILCRNGKLIVKPNCKETIGCLKYGKWNKHRNEFAESKVYGHFDALASLIYKVRTLDMGVNPIPRTFNLDQNNQILLNRRQESENTRELRLAFGLK